MLYIVHGSGSGPTLFLGLSQDFNTLSSNNELIKFADDSTLLVPENSDISVAFTNVGLGYRTGLSVTKEIIFYNPRAILSIPILPSISHIEQVTLVKVNILLLFQVRDFILCISCNNC